MWALQPHTGRPGQAGLWCLGIGAGIALVVRMLSLGSQVDVSDLVPLLSAVFTLLGSVVVGWVSIRARVFPAAVGWLLLVGGVLNLLGGLIPAGLFTTLVGISSGLAEAVAVAGYGWTINSTTMRQAISNL
jgi:hypothetical protein